MLVPDAWYAIQVRCNWEQKVLELLRGGGYEVFLPTYVRRLFRRGRTHCVEDPIFKGYVFCRFNANSEVKITRSARFHVVGNGKHPLPINDDEIRDIQAIASSEIARKPWQHMPYGSRVSIATGPLQGVSGVVASDNESRHLIVSVTLLQRSVSVVLEEGISVCPLNN